MHPPGQHGEQLDGAACVVFFTPRQKGERPSGVRERNHDGVPGRMGESTVQDQSVGPSLLPERLPIIAIVPMSPICPIWAIPIRTPGPLFSFALGTNSRCSGTTVRLGPAL